MLQERLLINLFYYAAFVTPIFSLFGLAAIYVNYAIVFFIALYSLSYKKQLVGVASLLCVALFFYIVILVDHVDDYGSITNISAMLFVWLFIVIFLGSIFGNHEAVCLFVDLMPKFIISSIIIYFFISIFLSMVIDVENPILTLLSGDRLKLLSNENSGHSILIDLSFLGLVFAYARVSLFKGKVRFFYIVFFIILLALSKTTTAWVLILHSSLIFIIEKVRYKMNKLGILIYTVSLVFVAFFFINADGFNFLLEGIRSNIQGNDTSIYGDDLTAGRTELNMLLFNGIKESPILGIGHGHPILQDGLQDANGFGAKTESGLRIAAKYGIPFFIAMLSVVLLPMKSFFSKSFQCRYLCISIPLGILSMLSSNSVLEVPHGFGFLFYLPLSLIIYEKSRYQD